LTTTKSAAPSRRPKIAASCATAPPPAPWTKTARTPPRSANSVPNGWRWIPPKTPLALLRDFLLSPEAKLLTRSCDRGLAELVLQAIHLQLKGKKLTKLEPSTEGAEAFRALQPERVAKITALFHLAK